MNASTTYTPGITVFPETEKLDFITRTEKGRDIRDSLPLSEFTTKKLRDGTIEAHAKTKIAGRVADVTLAPNDKVIIKTQKRTMIAGRADSEGQRVRYFASFDQETRGEPGETCSAAQILAAMAQ